MEPFDIASLICGKLKRAGAAGTYKCILKPKHKGDCAFVQARIGPHVSGQTPGAPA